MIVKITTEKEINITRTDWEEYLRVRNSGITNMYDLTAVEELSGLSKDKQKAIHSHWNELKDYFTRDKESGNENINLITSNLGGIE